MSFTLPFKEEVGDLKGCFVVASYDSVLFNSLVIRGRRELCKSKTKVPILNNEILIESRH